ncbi:MAG: hypothetical protein UU88_C0005G0037 [Parcubacteria group bacterium GW2011_GWC1_42_11]|uniref:Uncharacterized protein n=1 Tax=Candidatus Nomurabacteria bacterium GW2011_GWC2_42_20 TaxID=1618756 RepID=A0A0G1CAU2_9BACT|nr:MAG: hypothetical protein UU88_C0005G0037 [Parcubacteria group bacterium GW2011_GWC1_42_11]KKS46748.1 MAG: hypothetical protein UV12_C0017G0002 [Candidatus Nomurabacteria bacterium GW2011_GWC2_42_20]KKT08224.1 MAG: hypothetical protein UV86_C0021G0002 [Candidatus Nomurabacteria bacterium GW2011_GWB1_43_20]
MGERSEYILYGVYPGVNTAFIFLVPVPQAIF